jgi:hypothetical protein
MKRLRNLRELPFEDYPQVVYYTGSWMWKRETDVFAARPLTLTGLLKGVGRNFIVMRYWRFMVFLRILGLLSTPELGRLSWGHLTYRVWDYQMWWRLVPRWAHSLYRRLRRT